MATPVGPAGVNMQLTGKLFTHMPHFKCLHCTYQCDRASEGTGKPFERSSCWAPRRPQCKHSFSFAQRICTRSMLALRRLSGLLFFSLRA